MPHRRRALTIVLCALVSVPVGLAWTLRQGATTPRRDVIRVSGTDGWQTHRPDAPRSSIAIDTNADGRSDVEELYENGVLVRRESDRDFDNQIDLVQDFDPATRQIVRSITDVNADGVADLLVLFQNGKPVFSKWVTAIARVARDDSDVPASARRASHLPLAPLVDPFSGDLAYKPVRVDTRPDEPFGLPAPLGMPATGTGAGALATFAPATASDWRVPTLSSLGPSDLRGPPSSLPDFS
jgi:hypothetical protein